MRKEQEITQLSRKTLMPERPKQRPENLRRETRKLFLQFPGLSVR